nr:hypothetical protein [Nannocystis sp. RBIL2]
MIATSTIVRPARAGLDDRLEGVGEAVVDEQRGGGPPVHGPKAARRVAHCGARGAPDHARAPALQQPLERAEVRDGVGLAIAHDEVGAAGEDRRAQASDVGAGVLIVGVGVDDDVGAEREAGVDAGLERDREPAVAREAQHVVHADLLGHGRGVVGAAVVDDEHLDAVDPRQRAREVGEGRRQVLPLVEAGDLDDELHRAGRRTLYHGTTDPRVRPADPRQGRDRLRSRGRPARPAPRPRS